MMIPYKKSLLQKVKDFFTNVGATLLLATGLAITGGGIGIAIWLLPVALAPILIAAFGGFAGGWVSGGASRRFVGTPHGPEGRLAKAEAEVLEARRENLEICEKLNRSKEENEKLQHRLMVFANITQIQPAAKFVPGELTFDITDFCEKELKPDTTKKHLLSRKLHNNPEFYRGVCRYSGKMNLAVDLTQIKVVETANEIMICGPFEYERLLGLDSKIEWLMHGRREQEFRHGSSKNDMDTYRIEVTKTCDTKLEGEQQAALQENLKYLKVVESMRAFTDGLVIDHVKMMLGPTGKLVTYSPTIPEGSTIRTLSELAMAHNKKMRALAHAGEEEGLPRCLPAHEILGKNEKSDDFSEG